MISLDSKECCYCGFKGVVLLDHFIPKTFLNSDKQCVPCCKRCNASKKNSHPRIWYFTRSYFSKDKWNDILSFLNMTEDEIDEAMKIPWRKKQGLFSFEDFRRQEREN